MLMVIYWVGLVVLREESMGSGNGEHICFNEGKPDKRNGQCHADGWGIIRLE